MSNNLRVIITGSTGMVGEGVMHECLQDQEVDRVLVINRKPCFVSDPKLIEIIHKDFFDITGIASQLKGYTACFFCLGVSSVGMKEPEYYNLTYTLTLQFARVLSGINPDMTFCYISGSGTDSSEKGRIMWARVKGKTENDLTRLPFKRVFNFRPGFMHPTKGLKNTLSYYKYVNWLYPVFRLLLPNFVSTLKELGLAMIHASKYGYEKKIIEVKDIKALANRN
jgi:nucleoside-diphosphate-sugar epimerase